MSRHSQDDVAQGVYDTLVPAIYVEPRHGRDVKVIPLKSYIFPTGPGIILRWGMSDKTARW